MPVFVSTTFLSNQSSVLEAIHLLTEYNIVNIELGSIHRPEDNLGSKLKKLGCNYMTHNFFPPMPERIVLNIASINEQRRHRSLEFIKRSIDFAEEIGARIHTIHGGFMADPVGETQGPKNYDFNFLSNKRISISTNCALSLDIFVNSLRELAEYLINKSITLAVETQGSISKKDFMLFSKPEEFEIFLKEIPDKKIGLNLNLGHLNLAANAWGFDKYRLAEMLKPRIMAIEVSHNEGLEDSHLALKADGWYMDFLQDNFFKNIPVIFEGRNLDIDEVIESYRLLEGVLN